MILETETFKKVEPRRLTPEETAAMVLGARQKRRWSQENMADEAKVTVRTLQRIEAGEGVAGIDTLRRMEKVVDVPDGFFTTPIKLPTEAQMEEIEEEIKARYLTLDAIHFQTGQQLTAFLDSIGAWQYHFDERKGEEANSPRSTNIFINRIEISAKSFSSLILDRQPTLACVQM